MFHRGMNQDEFDRAFRSLGGRIEAVRRTGEKRYSHALVPRRPRVNGRRKDTTRELINYGSEVEQKVRDRREQ